MASKTLEHHDWLLSDGTVYEGPKLDADGVYHLYPVSCVKKREDGTI